MHAKKKSCFNGINQAARPIIVSTGLALLFMVGWGCCAALHVVWERRGGPSARLVEQFTRCSRRALWSAPFQLLPHEAVKVVWPGVQPIFAAVRGVDAACPATYWALIAGSPPRVHVEVEEVAGAVAWILCPQALLVALIPVHAF